MGTTLMDFLISLLKSLLSKSSTPLPTPVSPPEIEKNGPMSVSPIITGTIHMELRRKWFSAKSTIGELYVNGVFQCNTLEDQVRADGVKIYGETAIPAGTYKVTLDAFRGDKSKMYPLLHDVPMFTGIFMHGGNSDLDSLGCILLGSYDPKTPDFIGNSVASRDALLLKLKDAKQIDITIINDRTA